jgi:hypothetical protein
VAKVTLRNVSPLGDLDLPLIGRQGDHCLKAGEEFEVDATLAGRAPSAFVGEDGNEITDPGEGLLAQVGVFEPVDQPKSNKSAKPAAGANTPEV